MGFFKKLKEAFKKKSVVQEDKYVTGLDKSRKNFVDRLAELKARYHKVDEEYFEELEQILILSDVGVTMAMDIVDATRKEVQLKNTFDADEINEILVDKMFVAYANDDIITTDFQFKENQLGVMLVVGVNGVGKTTTIAKLCNRYKQRGKKVLLAAADTFRAGAVEQLKIWAERVKVDIVTGKENSDPSSVIFDAVKKAKEGNYEDRKSVV